MGTDDLVRRIDDLNREGAQLAAAASFDAAIAKVEEALALARKDLGSHPSTARSANHLATLYRTRARFSEAEVLYDEVLAMVSEGFGEDDPNVAAIRNNLAIVYRDTGRHEQAHAEYLKAVTIHRAAIESGHPHANPPELATTLNNLGRLERQLSHYEAARKHLEESLTLREKLNGKESVEYAQTLRNLAELEYDLGEYPRAEELDRQALAVYREKLDARSPLIAEALGSLAKDLRPSGRDAEAQDFLEEALRIWVQAHGETHPRVATAKGNLAALHLARGRLSRARELSEEALAIWRASTPDGTPDMAAALSTLASVYYEANDLMGAMVLFDEALEIWRRTVGEKTPGYAKTLGGRALTLAALGSSDAEDKSVKALATFDRVLGDRHPDTATAMLNLAELRRAADPRAAEKLLTKALEVFRATLGPDSEAVATALNNLGGIYQWTGRDAQAERCFHGALEIRRKVQGSEHPQVSITLGNLAISVAAMNRKDEALRLEKEAMAIEDRGLADTFRTASERQRTEYLRPLRQNLDGMLSLVSPRSVESDEAAVLGFNAVLRRKALEVEAIAARNEAVLGGRYPQACEVLAEWQALRAEVATHQLAAVPPEGVEQHARTLAALIEARDELESKLMRQIPEVTLDARLRDADHGAVLEKLPPGSALVEFASYREFDFDAVPSEGHGRWGGRRYLAFVACGGDETVQVIDLGEAAHIDRLVASVVARIGRSSDRVRHIGLGMEQPPDPSLEADPQELSAIAFDPLREAIGDRRRLFLAPDGELLQLPFEVLPGNDGGLLIDEFEISYLDTGRDLLRFGATSGVEADEPLVVADPDYDLGKGGSPRIRRRFGPLDGAAREGELLGERLGVDPLMRDEALEQRVKQVKSPAFLHLATHGFFDRNADPENAPGKGKIDNPLLRSGLALAGANAAQTGAELPAEAEDGVLHAEDVTAMDLLATEMVVLSACETGLGEVQIGEGVFGLRRAFAIAGVNTLVMSFWRVPDDQTQELMLDFYERVLAGEPRHAALRSAQMAIRERYEDPFYWGAFVCHGDPGPVQWRSLEGTEAASARAVRQSV